VLSVRGLGDELIARPEESYRLCCVVMCDPETSSMRRPWPALGRSATGIKNKYGKGQLSVPSYTTYCCFFSLRSEYSTPHLIITEIFIMEYYAACIGF